MSFINAQWLKERFKNETDDNLFDLHREITSFGGSESEKMMIEMESKRREAEHAQRDMLQGVSEGSEVAR